jgi:hypothetical protein
MFTGQTLKLASTGFAKDKKQMFMSLEKIKNFPNDTLIFPNEDSGLNNLIFARFLEPKNEFIDMRIN